MNNLKQLATATALALLAAPASATEIFDLDAGTYVKVNDKDTAIQIKQGGETQYFRDPAAAKPGAEERALTAADRKRVQRMLDLDAARSAEMKALQEQNEAKSRREFPDFQSNIKWDGPTLSNYDRDGCTDGRRMVYVKQGGFLGMGGKQVPISCMTEVEMNRWNIEQQNNRRPVVVPQPSNTYPRTRSCYGNRVGNQTFLNCF